MKLKLESWNRSFDDSPSADSSAVSFVLRTFGVLECWIFTRRRVDGLRGTRQKGLCLILSWLPSCELMIGKCDFGYWVLILLVTLQVPPYCMLLLQHSSGVLHAMLYIVTILINFCLVFSFSIVPAYLELESPCFPSFTEVCIALPFCRTLDIWPVIFHGMTSLTLANVPEGSKLFLRKKKN